MFGVVAAAEISSLRCGVVRISRYEFSNPFFFFFNFLFNIFREYLCFIFEDSRVQRTQHTFIACTTHRNTDRHAEKRHIFLFFVQNLPVNGII